MFKLFLQTIFNVCYLANFALLRRQQMTVRASNGKPKIQDTIGTTIDSGVTEKKKFI